MTKILIGLLLIFILILFFFLPIIPSKFILQTKAQKIEQENFCMTHGCGLLVTITPYEFIKTSFINLFLK